MKIALHDYGLSKEFVHSRKQEYHVWEDRIEEKYIFVKMMQVCKDNVRNFSSRSN